MEQKLATLMGGIDSVRLTLAMVLSVGVHAGVAWWADGVSLPQPQASAPHSVQVKLVATPAREVLDPVVPELRDVLREVAFEVPAPQALALVTAAVPPQPLTSVLPQPAHAVATPSVALIAREPPRTAPPARAPVRPQPATAAAPTPSTSPPPAFEFAATATPQAAPKSAARVAPPPARAQPPASGPALDIPPRAIAGNAPPRYPASARRLGQEGRVVLRLEVLPDGSTSAPSVVYSSGVASLDQAAQAAVARWRFTPASAAGRAVAATVEVPIVFRLDGRG